MLRLVKFGTWSGLICNVVGGWPFLFLPGTYAQWAWWQLKPKSCKFFGSIRLLALWTFNWSKCPASSTAFLLVKYLESQCSSVPEKLTWPRVKNVEWDVCVHFSVFGVSKYRIVASTSPSCFEAHAGLFRLLIKGILILMYCDLLTKSWFSN